MIQIAIVADYDPTNETHLATDSALAHAAAAQGITIEPRWLATDLLANGDIPEQLAPFDAIFIGPASPYRSQHAVVAAIQFARTRRVPLIGTCGGSQHIVLEFARHVLGFADAEHAEYDPYASRLFLTRLPCSLVGKTLKIEVIDNSMAAQAYGQRYVEERYYCNFGLNDEHRSILEAAGLLTTGVEAGDESTRGAVRIVEVADHPFFVGTLFVPQMRSTADSPHPLISAFVRAAARAKR